MLQRMQQTDLFSQQLAGPCKAARRVWNIGPDESVDWCVAVVNRSAKSVQPVVDRYATTRLLIVNTPEECVIGGRRQDVRAAIQSFRSAADLDPSSGAAPFHQGRLLAATGRGAGAIDALRAGRHVLCEKAFAVNTSQAVEMIDTAATEGRFLMEAMWSWFMPAWIELRRRIEEGAIGTVRLVDATFGIPVFDENSRLRRPDLTGGALLDLGIYPLALARWVLGEPTSVVAAADLTDQGVEADEGPPDGQMGAPDARTLQPDAAQPFIEALPLQVEPSIDIRGGCVRPDRVLLDKVQVQALISSAFW